ncbi:MAG: peptide chain release factor N(5)-glutamine methyltransferase [Bdellovibrionales bacterium]
MKVKEVLDKTIQFFREKKMEQARFEAEWLIGAGLGLDRVQLYMKYDQPLKENEIVKLREFVKRRVQGEPLAYIAGVKGFYGFDFIVNKDVLIPRPETETLVEKALDFIKLKSLSAPKIIDLGTGSGCVGLTLAKKISGATVTLLDISPAALLVARQNAENLKILDRVSFIESDAAEFLKGTDETFDLILANPPYISPDDKQVDDHVRKFEPHLALFADSGTRLLKTWSEKAQGKLKSPGLMLMEMGHDQGEEMKTWFESFHFFSQVQVIQDLSKNDRVILGERN